VQQAGDDLAAHPLAERQLAHGCVEKRLELEQPRQRLDPPLVRNSVDLVDVAEQFERVTRRQYLTSKRVTIWSETERLHLAIPGVRVITAAGYRAEFDVALDVTTVGHVVDAALKQGSVRDLAIEDAPLDAVIRALYSTASVAADRTGSDAAAALQTDVAAGLPPSLKLPRTAEALAEAGQARNGTT